MKGNIRNNINLTDRLYTEQKPTNDKIITPFSRPFKSLVHKSDEKNMRVRAFLSNNKQR
jgi:hypothetical protein